MLKLKLQYLATWCEELINLKRPWYWDRFKAGEGDNRRWHGRIASPTQWTWVWTRSRSWWWTGRPGMLQLMGSQRVGHDWAIELNWTGGQRVKNLPAMQETWVQSLGWEDPLEKSMATHSSIHSCLENPHEQRRLVGYSPWGPKSQTWLSDYAHTHEANLCFLFLWVRIFRIFIVRCWENWSLRDSSRVLEWN